MARHDYRCPLCGEVLRDQFRSATEGGRARLPICTRCHTPMAWIPQARFDLRSDATHGSFAKFATTDGAGRPVVIDSLHTLRRVERESEQLERNGEGQRLTFRAWANERTNKDVNTHGERRAPEIDAKAKQKFGLRGGGKALGEAEPERAFGPGVSESNATALPMSGKE